MWMNFLKTAQALVDTRDASMEVSRMLRDYNAKIYPISDDQFGDYFVEFEREADMIYFKMEWSRSGSIQITSFPLIKGDDLRQDAMELLNTALEKYHGTLTSHPTRQYRIITFEHEKDYLYYLMEWS